MKSASRGRHKDSSSSGLREPIRLNLALQGGGTHGAFSWGVIDALLEDGRFEFDTISAVGAGAINAALLASAWSKGRAATRSKLSDFWHAVAEASQSAPVFAPSLLHTENFAQVLSPFDAVTDHPYAPMQRLLEELVDFGSVRQSRIQIYASAMNIDTGRVRIFDGKTMNSSFLLASNSMPFSATAYKIDNVRYWGDGVAGNPPLFPIFNLSTVPDILLLQQSQVQHDFVPNSAPEIAERITELQVTGALISELRAIEFVQRLIYEGRISDDLSHEVFMHLIDGTQAISSVGGSDGSSEHYPGGDFLTSLFEKGRAEAFRWATENSLAIGRSATADMLSLMGANSE